MKKLFFLLPLIALCVAVSSCRNKTDEDYLMERVDSFATNFYNWQLEMCVPQVTAESVKTLGFIASNITQEDVDLLRSAEMAATYEINNVDVRGNEADVELTVYNFFSAGEIDQPLQRNEEAVVRLHLVKENRAWKVEL